VISIAGLTTDRSMFASSPLSFFCDAILGVIPPEDD